MLRSPPPCLLAGLTGGILSPMTGAWEIFLDLQNLPKNDILANFGNFLEKKSAKNTLEPHFHLGMQHRRNFFQPGGGGAGLPPGGGPAIGFFAVSNKMASHGPPAA